MLICGTGWTVAQRTIIETGQAFGWIAVCFFIFDKIEEPLSLKGKNIKIVYS